MEQLSFLEQSRLEHPGKSDEFRVARICERILREVGGRPPVSLPHVASWCGIHRVDEVDLDCAGCLVPRDGHMIVQLRQRDSRGRQRFTGFHEVAHTFFPGFSRAIHYRCDPLVAPDESSRIEAMCDLAASELLLPRREFVRDLGGADFGIENIEELASDYDASIEATANRFVALWPEEAMLLVLEPGWRKGEEHDPTTARLRVKYASPSGDWPFIPRNKSAPDDSPLVRALGSAGEIVSEKAALQGLGCPTVAPVAIAAKRYSYRRGTDVQERVLAVYRKLPRSRRGSNEG